MKALFRAAAVAIAVAGAVDPAISISRPRPVAVELRGRANARTDAVRQRLVSEIGSDVTLADPGRGDAIVIIGDDVAGEAIREQVTVSTVILTPPPNVRLVRAYPPRLFLPGQDALIEVEADVQGLAGRSSVLTVAQAGVEVGRVTHTWTGSRRQRVGIPFLTVAPGAHHVRVAAAPLREETRDDDNALDTKVSTVDRPLRVAFVEPRPSWSAGFVRRVLESDPAFEVASLLRASRGIDIRAGDTPASLTATALERFDVLVAGAPEELQAADLEALRRFMSERGGTVFLLPDRRPSAAAVAFITLAGFDEVLLAGPVALETAGSRLRASEFAIPRSPGPAIRALAWLADGRPAIASWPVGDGMLIFSGALDAWRFRGDEGIPFAGFWRASIAAAALASPPKVQVNVEPGAVRSGAETRVLARIRRTEFEDTTGGAIRLPTVSAAVIDASGKSEPFRLWPTTEPGVFHGRVTPAAPGLYDVRVSMGGAGADATLIVLAEDSIGTDTGDDDDEEAAAVAGATGGVVAMASNLDPLVNHLRSLRRSEIEATVHPMRSAWWVLPFALALCAEWTMRRRRGSL